jgi:hypothetical protein
MVSREHVPMGLNFLSKNEPDCCSLLILERQFECPFQILTSLPGSLIDLNRIPQASDSGRNAEPGGSGFARDNAIGGKRWALKRFAGENDGGEREARLRFAYFMQCQANIQWIGNIMLKNIESKNIDQLLAEADELIERINSDFLKDMKEEHLLQFEIHAQKLKKIKSEVQDEIEKKGTSEIGSSAEGIHEAIQDIVKAMHDLTKYFS